MILLSAVVIKVILLKNILHNYFLTYVRCHFRYERNKMTVHQKSAEPWTVTLGGYWRNTMTGGRLKESIDYIKDEEAFCFTYGDGVSDVILHHLIEFHNLMAKSNFNSSSSSR